LQGVLSRNATAAASLGRKSQEGKPPHRRVAKRRQESDLSAFAPKVGREIDIAADTSTIRLPATK